MLSVLFFFSCNTSEMLNVNVGHRDSASICVSFKVPKMKGCSKAYLHVKVSWCLKSWLRMEVKTLRAFSLV